VTTRFPDLVFATPRKLPRAKDLQGRVVVLDVAFASEASGGGFDKITRPLIEGLGDRLAMWVDHHDHALHARYADDPRFVLRTKQQHGACPELVTPELVARAGAVDTIVCHTDFDGLASAAKWIRGGEEPYPGCDADARAIDTRIGKPSAVAERIDRAVRASMRDTGIFGLIVRHLANGLRDASLWGPIDEQGARLAAIEESTRKLAEGYITVTARTPMRGAAEKPLARVAFLQTPSDARFDKTLLLLLGQERADIAMLIDRDTLSLAAPFDSGANFLTLLGLSGGMPTLVSVPKARAREVCDALGLADVAQRLA
jgi:hypothetical protein